MAANSSFTLNGANPLGQAPRSTISPFNAAGTPAASALNYAQSTPAIKPISLDTKPTTPVKKVTLNADGSQTAEYHAPAKAPGSTGSSAPQTGTNTGVLTPDTVQQNLKSYYSQNPQVSSGYFGTDNSGSNGVIPNPDVQSPARGTAPQVAPATSYASTDNSPAAVAYRAQNPTTNLQPGLIQNLLNVSQGNPDVAKANQDVLSYKQAVLDKQGAIAGTGNDLAFKTGQEQVLQQTAQAGLAAREAALTNALTSQGQQIGAAGTAASLTAPTTQFGLLTSPQTGAAISPNAGGTLNPLNNISSIAQQVLNKQISPQQALAMGGSVSNFQSALNAEILKQNPNANLAQLQGEYDAKQSNTTLAGTATQTANNNIYQQAYSDYQNLNQTVRNVDQFGGLLVQNMGGINPSDVKYANQSISQIRSQLSNAQQAQFDTTFAQLRAQIANLLSTGGAQIPTQITADANKIIDGSAPLGTLQATMQRIQTEGNILLGNLGQKVNDAKAGLSGQNAPATTPAGTSGGGDYQAYLKSIGQAK